MKYHCNSCGYTYNPYVALMEFNTRNAAKPKYMIDHPTTQVEVEDEELSEETLIEIANSARDSAFAQYSEYPVGAALNTDNGIFTGCNIECSGLSTSVHAEMLAFFKAVEDGATEFYQLAVSVEGDVMIVSDEAALHSRIAHILRPLYHAGPKMSSVPEEDSD